MRFGSIVPMRPFRTAEIADHPLRAATSAGLAAYGSAASTMTSGSAFTICSAESRGYAVVAVASAGSSEKSSTPTTRGPAPIANRNAVMDGPIDTRRSGRAESVTAWPWKSVTVVGNGALAAGGVGVGRAVAPQAAANVRKRTARSVRIERERIWLTPFSRRCVGRERVIQATRVGAMPFTVARPCRNLTGFAEKPAYSVVRGDQAGTCSWVYRALSERWLLNTRCRVITCAQRPEVRKWSHSQDQSSPLRETAWVPLSPRNATSKLRKEIRSGSSAYRFAFSILEMRLEYITSSTNPDSSRLGRTGRV